MNSSGWIKYKLEDLADFHDSKRIPLNTRERETRKGTFPYYGASGIVDYIDDYIFDGEYVLISEDGENLRSRTTPIAFKANGKFWVNNHAHVIQGKEQFLNDWIVYFFQNLDLNPYITGAVQPKLNRENLQLIEIPMPDIEKAKKIVSILSALDDKIELNRQTNATLEAIAQAIFKEWFVDFNFPGSTGELVESDLGMIPKGWRVGSVADILVLANETMSPGVNPDKLFNHYSISAFDSGRIPSQEPGSTILSNKYKVKSNSILVSKLNPRIPRIWTLKEVDQESSICSTEFQVLLPQKAHYYSFAANLFSKPSIIDTMKSRASGTSSSHQRINPQDILDINIIIPTDDLLALFDKIVGDNYHCVINGLEESINLAKIRDSLLPKLMNGEIRI
ncbi:MAG: hypothetical protein GYA45_07070 [Pelolinea sp.]|jgi:type I restriction enzyme S subunit|nr:hypothetical protein [Pelolinea sp.]